MLFIIKYYGLKQLLDRDSRDGKYSEPISGIWSKGTGDLHNTVIILDILKSLVTNQIKNKYQHCKIIFI